MWFVVIFVAVYVICAVLGFGIAFAYAEHEWRHLLIAENLEFAKRIAILGPVGLCFGLVTLIHKRKWYGFKFTDGCTWVRK